MKTRSVNSNLIQQNCYLRDCVRCDDLKSVSSDKTYVSLDEVVTDQGVTIKKVVVPYHITPDYVQSFADSTDYRRDPAQAIANGSKRVNLGDLTGFQSVQNMDSTQLASTLAYLKSQSAVVEAQIAANNDLKKEGE